MKKIAIIETSLKSANPIDAHVRNSIEIQKVLVASGFDCDLLFSNIPYLKKKYDFIVYSYSSFYFQFEAFRELIEHQDSSCRFGWITNEYNISPNGYYKDSIEFVISNFEETKKKKFYQTWKMVNLNTLLAYPRNAPLKKKYDCLYYGTFREGRSKYFKKYLDGGILLSTSSKNKKKYKVVGCTSKVFNKLDWSRHRETLNYFRASLYIEDEFTHKVYNHLANRFYEGVSCNVATFFDSNCQRTINLSGYNIDPFFVVNSSKEILERIKDPCFEDLTEKFLVESEAKMLAERDSSLLSIAKFFQEL